MFDNGLFKNTKISSRHPNIVRSVIIGKKSWGLQLNEWADGIVEGSFTKQEILNDFKILDIQIPESLMVDFENRIYEKMKKKVATYQNS
jgi:hypothetical protein